MGDFFGDYVAPGILLTGAGVTAYRTYKDISAKGTMTAPWRIQKQSSALYSKIKGLHENRYRPTAASIAELFFPDFINIFPGSTPETRTAGQEMMGRIRSSAVSGLISNHQLKARAIELGITPETMGGLTPDKIAALLGATPDNPYGIDAYREYLSRVARTNDLGRLKTGGEGALKSLVEANQSVARNSGLGETLSAMKSKGAFSGSSTKAGFENVQYTQRKLMAGLPGRDDLVMKVHQVYERVRALAAENPKAGLSMSLTTLQEAGETIYTGYTIRSGKKVLSLPFENANGIVRTGPGGRTRSVAKWALAENIESILGTFTDVSQIARRADVAITDYMLNGGLQDFVKGTLSNSHLTKQLWSKNKDDLGKLFVPTVANEASVRRQRGILSTARSAVNPALSPAQIEVLKRRLIDIGHPAVAGLSANQVTGGNIFIGDYVYGSSPIGPSSDAKAVAQSMREGVFSGLGSKNRSTPAIFGKKQKAMGDIRARLRVMSVPESVANAFLSLAGRADVHLHEDELMLLDNNLPYTKFHSTGTIGENAVMSEKIAKIGKAETPQMQRLQTMLRTGLTADGIGWLEAEREGLIQLANSPGIDDAKRIAYIDEAHGINEMLETIRFKPGEFIGMTEDGVMLNVPSNAGTYTIRSMTDDGVKGLKLEALIDRKLGLGDKVFGTKGIIKEEAAARFGHKMGAMWEYLRETPEMIEALEKGDHEKMKGVLEPTYKQIVAAEKAALGRGEDLPDLWKVIDSEQWRAATRETRGAQLLSVQGTKKIGDANMGALVQGLMEELHAELPGIGKAGVELLDKARWRDTTLDEFLQMSPEDQLVRKSQIEALQTSKALGLEEKEFASLTKRREGILSLGFDDSNGAVTIIDDGSHKMTDRFDKVVELTVQSPGRRGRWSSERFWVDLENNKDFFSTLPETFRQEVGSLSGIKDKRVRMGKSIRLYKEAMESGLFATETGRKARIAALEPQLQFGALNRDVTPHGSPILTGGAGREGSFSLQTLLHTQAQRGAVAEAGLEAMGRMSGNTRDEAMEIYKRNAYFDRTSDYAGAIKVSDMSKVAPSTIEGLFSPSQETRDAAFGEMRKTFNVKGDLVFDTGNAEKRFIYHPQGLSTHTGGYTVASNMHIPTEMDAALQGILEGGRLGNRLDQGLLGSYAQSLADITLTRDQNVSRAFSGHVQGSMRMQARSGANADFFEFLATDKNYSHKVGIKESNLIEMMDSAGIAGDAADEMVNELKGGRLAGLIHRAPDTELHRITGATAFSLDEALGKYANSMMDGQKKNIDLLHWLREMSKSKHDQVTTRIVEDAAKSQELLEKINDLSATVKKRYKPSLLRRKSKEFIQELQTRKNNARAALDQILADNGINLEGKAGPEGGWNNFFRKRNATNERRFLEEAVRDVYKTKHKGAAMWLPKSFEGVLGADFDDDAINFFLVKNENTRYDLRERVLHSEKLKAEWGNQSASGAPEEALVERLRPRNATIDQLHGEEDFLYNVRQKELYANLKSKDPSVITPEALDPSSEVWKMRQRAQNQMAMIEKAQIGSMSNATDFARAMARASGAASPTAHANSRLFAEMLLGIMPESILKVRQVPINQVEAVGNYAKSMEDALRGEHGAGAGAVAEFRENFRRLHGVKSGSIVDKIASDENIKAILEAGVMAKKNRHEYSLLTALKNTEVTDATRQAAMNAAREFGGTTMQHELYRDATRGIVEEVTPLQRNLKNTASSFSEAYDIMLKHKKPLVLGAGLAIATSMLLGSPGSISSEEADAAGARHSTGSPTTPPTDMGHSARVATNTGRAVRIRGSSNGDVDPSVIAAKLGERFPGSSVNFTVNDYRERINQEYIRKKLDR